MSNILLTVACLYNFVDARANLFTDCNLLQSISMKYHKLMDKKNRAILSYLNENGRMTLTELGEHLDMSHVAARKRLRSLGVSATQARRPRGRELVRLVPALNVNSLDLHFVTVLAEVEGAKAIQKFEKMYKKCPRLIFMSETVGNYNLISIWVAEDIKAVQSIANSCAVRCQDQIRKSEVLLATSPNIPSHVPINLVRDESREEESIAPCGIECESCHAYEQEKCPGCPSTKFYRGPL
ncbi:MAG: AsnC family transcriptional regulator [Candidatus Hodarchaeota archaeon]